MQSESSRKKVVSCLWRNGDAPRANYYGPEDVFNLARTVHRHCPDADLYILTDDECYDLVSDFIVGEGRSRNEAVAKIIKPIKFEGHGIGGWSNVLEAFRPGLFPNLDSERVLLVGLDTVFVGNCDWLFEWNECVVGLPRDPYYLDKACDAVVTYGEVGRDIVWREYCSAKRAKKFPYVMGSSPSEMILLRHLFKEHKWGYLESGFNKLKSYKVQNLGKAQKIPAGTSIVYFHGYPKPGELPKDDPVRIEWER